MNDKLAERIKKKFEDNTWKSSFNFEKYQIDNETKDYIIIREEMISNNFKKYSTSKYEICKAIYEVKVKLYQKDESFVDWYTHNGLSKDKVSELMKTFELYIQAPHLKDFISSLSGAAVKMLTHKKVFPELALAALEQKLTNMNEIREFLDTNLQEARSLTIKEDKKELTNSIFQTLKKRINSSGSLKDLKNIEKDILSLKKALSELEKNVRSKENELQNKNNLKLI